MVVLIGLYKSQHRFFARALTPFLSSSEESLLLQTMASGSPKSPKKEQQEGPDFTNLEGEIYWTNTKIRFCAILTEDFHHKLLIPKNLADKMRAVDSLPKVTLQGPTGACWDAVLMAGEDGMFLKDGWDEFAEAHSLEERDKLLFEVSRINVEEGDDDGDGVCNAAKKARLAILRRKVETKYSTELPKLHCDVDFRIPNRRVVTEEEKNETFKMAQESLTEGSFLVVMRPTYCYKRYYMSIPAKWAAQFLAPENRAVNLQVGEKTWPMLFHFHNHILSHGWAQFASDNNLEEFDVCLFKLVRQENGGLMFDVTIFRVGEVRK